MGDLRLEASCLIDISSHEVELEWRPETLGMRIIVMKIENNKHLSPVEQFYIRCCVLSQFIHGSKWMVSGDTGPTPHPGHSAHHAPGLRSEEQCWCRATERASSDNGQLSTESQTVQTCRIVALTVLTSVKISEKIIWYKIICDHEHRYWPGHWSQSRGVQVPVQHQPQLRHLLLLHHAQHGGQTGDHVQQLRQSSTAESGVLSSTCQEEEGQLQSDSGYQARTGEQQWWYCPLIGWCNLILIYDWLTI